ncbi:glycosyltransferase, partial [Candidatus Hydrogenedentota bacterium]
LAAWTLKKLCKAKFVYDSHELFASRNIDNPLRPLLDKTAIVYEHLFIRGTDAVTAGATGYAREIKRRYKLAEVIPLLNCPYRCESFDDGDSIKAMLPPEDQDAKLLVYVGLITFNRGIEESLEALKRLPDEYRLVLIGPENGRYVAKMRERCEREGIATRVRFLPPVHFQKVPQSLHGAFLSVVLIVGVCESYRLTQPNKMFESIQARVPVLITDLPGMRETVDQYDCGVVVKRLDADEIAQAILKLSHHEGDHRLLVENCAKAASELCWEKEAEKLIAVYERLGESAV